MSRPTRPQATIQMPRWVKKLPELIPNAAQRALRDTRDALLEQARINVGSKGPRFLRVRTGRLLRSLRTDLRVQGQDTVLTLRAARHGWIWENHKRNPRKWATDATKQAGKRFPAFLAQAVRREQGRTS